MKNVKGGSEDEGAVCKCNCTAPTVGSWEYGAGVQPSLASLKKGIKDECGTETNGSCESSCTNWAS